jgi:tetratricopeptide (TPR) repeat protein
MSETVSGKPAAFNILFLQVSTKPCKEETMSNQSPITRRRLIWILFGILLLLVVILFAYHGYQSQTEKGNYEKGHQAYLQADCVSAETFLGKIAGGAGQYAQPAQQDLTECQAFQAALNLETSGNLSTALVSYLDFIASKGNSPLAQRARGRIVALFQNQNVSTLADESSCTRIGTLLNGNLIPNPETSLPVFYLACGQVYERANQPTYAFALYQWILISYPDHPVSTDAESFLLGNPSSCEEAESLRQSAIGSRANFMPALYYNCGQKYEGFLDFASARKMYETFLSFYPDHPLAKDVKSAYAQLIVTEARISGGQELTQLAVVGSTASGMTEVVIKNDSPHRLRIAFSGPDPQVRELEACASCPVYTALPAYCSGQAVTGSYMLVPGVYDIVIESTADLELAPMTKNINLLDGSQYSTCIYVISQSTP